MADSGYKCISRIDHQKRNTHGWYVRVRFSGEMYSRLFSDSLFGGRRRALKAAVEWRNETERELGKPRTERVVLMSSSRNRTGVIGVRRTVKEGTPVYEATWNPLPGKVQRTSVSIAKYGEKEAFRRAVEIRKEKERELFGAELPSLPKAKKRKR